MLRPISDTRSAAPGGHRYDYHERYHVHHRTRYTFHILIYIVYLVTVHYLVFSIQFLVFHYCVLFTIMQAGLLCLQLEIIMSGTTMKSTRTLQP